MGFGPPGVGAFSGQSRRIRGDERKITRRAARVKGNTRVIMRDAVLGRNGIAERAPEKGRVSLRRIGADRSFL